MKNFLPFLILCLTTGNLLAQSSFSEIYTLFNTSCSSAYCHGSTSPQAGLDFSKSQLPECDTFAKSLFVNHFRKFATAETNHWSDEAKTSLEGYLEDMIFKGPRAVESYYNKLPILGLLGTTLGIADATLAKAAGASMFVGVGNAIGTTAIALYCLLFLSTLNQIVFAERSSLLKTVLVIFRIAQKGGDHGKEK